MRRDIHATNVAWGLVLVTLGAGCGTDPVQPTGTPPAISVTVTPATVSVPAGGSQDLSATVANDTAARGVNWTITACCVDTSECGYFWGYGETSVTYYAPVAVPPATLGVRATSVTDSTKSSTARVTLNATLWIAQAPTNSGNGQTATVGTALASPLRVLVRRGAEPAAGVTVHWDSLSGGVASSPSTTTDASGIATVTWTLGQLSGQQWAIASIRDTASRAATVRFAAFARPGPPVQLAFRVSPQNAFAGRPFTVIPQVAALDQYGNVATGFGGSVTVVLGPGGSLAGSTTVDASGGVARFTDLSVGQTGTGYALTASANGFAPVTSTPFDILAPISGRIAFGSDRADTANMCPSIYVMQADGSSPALIQPHYDTGYLSCGVTGPAWSPDGTKMAFSTVIIWRGGEYVDAIWEMNADGSQATQLSLSGVPRDTTHGYLTFGPAWSPDGARIAGAVWFTTKEWRCSPVGRGGGGCGWVWVVSGSRIFVANADGSGFLNLAGGVGPAWSPDGRIAFSNGVDILVMNAVGTGVINLTNETTPNAVNDAPAWSPDGRKIAFRSNRSGHADLYVMNADGTGVTRVTADTATEGRPAWSPDGTRLTFASDRDGDYEIYVMNADGSGVVQLTDNTAFDERPAWMP